MWTSLIILNYTYKNSSQIKIFLDAVDLHYVVPKLNLFLELYFGIEKV